MKRWHRLHSVLQFLSQSAGAGFAVGVLEGAWELFIHAKDPRDPAIYYDFGRLVVQVSVFSGGLWAAFGVALAILVGLLYVFRRRSVAAPPIALVWLGLLTCAIGLACEELIYRVFWHTAPAPSKAWWMISAISLTLGGFMGVRLIRDARRIVGRFPGTYRATVRVFWLGVVGIFIGWVALVAHLNSFHIDKPNRPLPSAQAPNVLVMVVDSLRADHVSLYGYAKKTTPSIDRLFGEGAVAFRQCQAASMWTRPAVATMITGRFNPAGEEFRNDQFSGIATNSRPLLERFHEAGYSTAWLSANPWASPFANMTHDADRLVIPRRTTLDYPLALCRALYLPATQKSPFHWWSKWGREWGQVADGAWQFSSWIWDATLSQDFVTWEMHQQKRPWIAYIHFMTVHEPYGDTHGKHLQPDNTRETLPPDLHPSEEDRRKMQPYLDAYDEDIPYTDYCIGQILTQLRNRGELAHTIVMITADHGEGFGDHGAMGHRKAFYGEVTRVPLLLYAPHLKGPRWISTPVHEIDLLPTLLVLAGLPVEKQLPGKNLAELADASPKDLADRPLPMYFTMRDHLEGMGLRLGAYELYRWRNAHGTYKALYDLQKDPAERHNLAGQEPQRVSIMEREMRAWGLPDESH